MKVKESTKSPPCIDKLATCYPLGQIAAKGFLPGPPIGAVTVKDNGRLSLLMINFLIKVCISVLTTSLAVHCVQVCVVPYFDVCNLYY